MTKRRPMTEARKDRVRLRQYERTGAVLPCALCDKPITPGELFIAEHMVPLALGGADDDGQENVRPVHPECAAQKTNGTDATGHRGDIAAIARARRLENGGKKRRGPKMKSRPFQKPEGMKRKIPGRRFSGEPIGKDAR